MDLWVSVQNLPVWEGVSIFMLVRELRQLFVRFFEFVTTNCQIWIDETKR